MCIGYGKFLVVLDCLLLFSFVSVYALGNCAIESICTIDSPLYRTFS